MAGWSGAARDSAPNGARNSCGVGTDRAQRFMPLSVLSVAALALGLAAIPVFAQTAPDPRAARRTPVVEVFDKTRDAVVSISATQVVERQVGFSSPFDDFFDFPGFPRRSQRYTATNLGSGFVIHPDGYVVTNAHVVASSAALKVIFSDHKEYEADIVAIDERHDLAVLKLKPDHPLPAVTLGRSDDLMIGETVIAIGNPLGYDHTVTSGIISATNRKLDLNETVLYEGLIQTDASINRGNSGGPLLNVLGELIGINTAIRGDAQNIGFAIPVDSLRMLLPEMLSVERTRRLAVGLRLGWRGRVYVVEATGPAAEARVEPGDELVAVDGIRVNQDLDFYIHMLDIPPNGKIHLQLKRDDKLIEATITPKEIPIPDGAALLRSKFGLSVRPLTADQARQYGIKSGLLIVEVENGSPAGLAEFRRGLIVVRIGKYPPSDLGEIGLMLENLQRGDSVPFYVYDIRRSTIVMLQASLIAR